MVVRKKKIAVKQTDIQKAKKEERLTKNIAAVRKK